MLILMLHCCAAQHCPEHGPQEIGRDGCWARRNLAHDVPDSAAALAYEKVLSEAPEAPCRTWTGDTISANEGGCGDRGSLAKVHLWSRHEYPQMAPVRHKGPSRAHFQRSSMSAIPSAPMESETKLTRNLAAPVMAGI